MELLILYTIILSLLLFQNKKNKKILYQLSIIVLFLFSSFKIIPGKDDIGYITLFDNLKKNSINIFETFQEPVFVGLLKILSYFFESWSLFFIISIISSIMLYKVSIKYCKYSILPILIYLSHKYLHNDLNQIRQGLVSLGLLLFVDTRKIKLKNNLIAMGIHILAIVYIPAKKISKINISGNKVRLLLFLLAIIISFYIKPDRFLFLFNDSKVYYYLIDNRFNRSINLLSNINFIKSTLFLIILNLNAKNLSLNFSKFNQLYNLYFIGYLILISFRNIEIISGRLSSIFFITEPFLIYYIYAISNKKFRFLIFLMIVIYTILLLTYNLFLTNNSPLA